MIGDSETPPNTTLDEEDKNRGEKKQSMKRDRNEEAKASSRVKKKLKTEAPGEKALKKLDPRLRISRRNHERRNHRILFKVQSKDWKPRADSNLQELHQIIPGLYMAILRTDNLDELVCDKDVLYVQTGGTLYVYMEGKLKPV